MLDDIRPILDGIIITASEIKREIEERWFTLFLDGDGLEAGRKVNAYKELTEKLTRIRKELSLIRDIILK